MTRGVATTQLAGRMGNCLWQICHLLSYAKLWDMDYYIPTFAPDLENNRLPFTIPSTGVQPKYTKPYTEPHKNFNSPLGGTNPYFHLIDKMDDIEFRGFWQSFKYFDWCRDYILDTFNFPVIGSMDEYVALHCRRGDCIGQEKAFPMATLDYYTNAINYFVELGHKEFLIFSDDIEWCKSQFNRIKYPKVDNFIFSEGRTPMEDFNLMASCAHNIVARSTFSYMSAWFNRNPDKIVVCDSDPHLFKNCNIDMQPHYFKKISGTGVKKVKLPNVTLFAVATQNVEQTVEALKYSMREIEFGTVKLVSHYKPLNLPADIEYEYCPKMDSIKNWNEYMLFSAWKHIDTDYSILVHADGFVVNAESWSDEFLQYDYIGALWPIMEKGIHVNPVTGNTERVGNSVGLRSKKLLRMPTEIDMPFEMFEGAYNEDTQLCVSKRSLLESKGIKFAPISVAAKFSRETVVEENRHIDKPFLFHRYHNSDHPNWHYPKF